MQLSGSSDALTCGVRVRVVAQFIPQESDPAANRFFFAYHVKIKNEGEQPVRLLSRHWIITDGEGRERHVKGPGVIGEQPHLAPGQEHEYTSYCPLETPSGSMRGTYQMLADDGSSFEALVGAFSLLVPQLLN